MSRKSAVFNSVENELKPFKYPSNQPNINQCTKIVTFKVMRWRTTIDFLTLLFDDDLQDHLNLYCVFFICLFQHLLLFGFFLDYIYLFCRLIVVVVVSVYTTIMSSLELILRNLHEWYTNALTRLLSYLLTEMATNDDGIKLLLV